jgi:hypothetical protein
MEGDTMMSFFDWFTRDVACTFTVVLREATALVAEALRPRVCAASAIAADWFVLLLVVGWERELLTATQMQQMEMKGGGYRLPFAQACSIVQVSTPV